MLVEYKVHKVHDGPRLNLHAFSVYSEFWLAQL